MLRFLRRLTSRLFDEVPELWILSQGGILLGGQIGTEQEILEGMLAEDAMDDDAEGMALKVDAVVAEAVPGQRPTVPGQVTVLPFLALQFLRQTSELSEHLELQVLRQPGKLPGAGGIENDLKRGHLGSDVAEAVHNPQAGPRGTSGGESAHEPATRPRRNGPITEDDPGPAAGRINDFGERTPLAAVLKGGPALTGLKAFGSVEPQRFRVRWFHVMIRESFLLVLVLVTGCGPQAGTVGTPGAARPDVAGSETTVPDPRQDLEAQGRYVFERNCVACHGRWGDGRGELAVGMVPRPNNLTRARFKFRSTPSGSLPTNDDLRRVITLGIAGSSMPAFAALPDRDIAAVITYLKTFSRRWDNPSLKAAPVALPAPPPWMEDPEARPEHARMGRELFRANCAPCHGDAGRGDGPAAAALEDDAGKPAPPHDLTTGLWKSGRYPADLFRTLSTGMDGTPMPSFGDALSVENRWDLVSYLLTLPTTSQPGSR